MRKTMVLLVVLLMGGSVWAGVPSDSTLRTIRGEVLAIQERVQTANGGEMDQLTVRCRRGVEYRLELQAGEGKKFQVGDPVWARAAVPQTEGAPLHVAAIQNQRTGERLGVGTGDRLHRRLRDGSCDGSPDRMRQRLHEPGTGGGSGSGGFRGGRGGRR